jgi:hypothetical protein
MVSKMRDDSQSSFAARGQIDALSEEGRWRPSWTGLHRTPGGMNDETLSALLLLVLSGAEEQRGAQAPASERIVNLLSEMEAHPRGSATDDAVRAGLITRLSAAISGLREELD